MGKGQEAGDFELGQALREKKTVKWEESCLCVWGRHRHAGTRSVGTGTEPCLTPTKAGAAQPGRDQREGEKSAERRAGRRSGEVMQDRGDGEKIV